MKLTKSIHKILVDRLEANNIPDQEYTFKKRKGWVFILHQETESSFEFIEKIEQHSLPGIPKWDKISSIKFRINGGNTKKCEDWDELSKHLDQWAKNLK